MKLCSWRFWLVLAAAQILCPRTQARLNRVSKELSLKDNKKPVVDEARLFDPKKCPFSPIQPYRTGTWDFVSPQNYSVDPDSLPMNCSAQHEFLVVSSAPSKSEDELWMEKYLGVPYKVYHAGNTSTRYHHANTANEAMAYFKFIAEHYDCLPEVTLFAHSHREKTWHRSATLDEAVKSLKWQLVRDRGYAILHKQGMWSDHYIAEPERNLVGRGIDMGNLDFHFSESSPYQLPDDWKPDCEEVINGTLYDVFASLNWHHAHWIRKTWTAFFQSAGLGPVPEEIIFTVGAEFLVSRERIRAHPRQFYLDTMAFVEWFHDNEVMTAYELGAVFESIWHIIFGEGPIFRMTSDDSCKLHQCS